MKVDEIAYNNSLANDPTAIGVSVSIKRGTQEFESFFITDTVMEEFGRVAGTMLSSLSMLEDDGVKAVPEQEIAAIRKVWRGLVHG